jgi:regulatory protein
MASDMQASLRARALRLLARREHSRTELHRKLSRDEVSEPQLAALLDELQRQGWLSEVRLAEQMIAAARGRHGSRWVLDRLRRKGVPDEALRRAAAAMQEQELDSARTVWRKRFGRPPADLREKAQQARFLAGRGFLTDTIQQLLGALDED